MDVTARGLATQNTNELVKNQLYCIRKSSARYEIWKRAFGNRWVVYEIWNNITAEENKNSWRIYKARVTTINEQTPLNSQTESNTIQLVNDGAQWEYAIMLENAPDFFGGFHGDEQVQNVLFIVDGKPFTLATKAFNRFEMVQHTICYDPIDSTTKVGDMYVRHIWTTEGFQLKFKFVWSVSRVVVNAYAAMIPALRGATVSTKCRLIDSPITHDISVTPHTRPAGDTYGMELWNDTNDVGIAVEFDDLSWFNGYQKSNTRGIWVSDSVNYNKIYPTRIHSDPAFTENVVAGDEWTASAKIRIFCRE